MERAVVLVAACLAATLAAGLFGAMAFVGMAIAWPDYGGAANPISAFIVFGIILTLYGAVATAVLGLPAHALLVHMRRTGIVAYAAAGLIAGALVSALFSSPRDLWVFIPGLVAGVLGATAFWLVARPDRLAAGKPVQS